MVSASSVPVRSVVSFPLEIFSAGGVVAPLNVPTIFIFDKFAALLRVSFADSYDNVCWF